MNDRPNIILVADDDPMLRGLIRGALKDFAIILEAKNGKDAIDLYKDNGPHLVLLDIHMPVKDGKEALNDILAFDKNAYVIMLSADAVRENVVETVHKGAKGFIVKPFSRDTLMDKVLNCPTLNFHDKALPSA